MNKLITLCLSAYILLISVQGSYSLAADECEVCISFLDKFRASLSSGEKSNPKIIDSRIRDFCEESKGKDNRFCYYVGGLQDSATGILGEITKPLSYDMPSIKICEKLKKKDGQICQLRYEKQIDLNTVDLKKLKVRDLKKILNDWDENCNDCLEKPDFIKRIEELKPLYSKTEL